MSEKTSKFHITPKPRVNPAALESFAANAGLPAGETPAPTVAQAPSTAQTTGSTVEQTKGFLLRLSIEQFARLEQVYGRSTFKSKQAFGEKLLMDGIEDMGKQLGV